MDDRAQLDEFQRVMLPHLDDAFKLACWLTGNRSGAEDVVQEAFLKAQKQFDTYRRSEARAWLLTRVCYCSISRARRVASEESSSP